MWNRLLWLTVFVSLSQTEAAKILAIPQNLNSHSLLFSQLGEGLSKIGHKIHIVIPANAKIPHHLENENLTFVVYDVDGDTPFANSPEVSQTFMKMALSDSKFEYISILYSFTKRAIPEYEKDCIHLFENKEVMDKLRNEEFDFAIMDPITPQCYYVVPYSLGIPYATLSLSFGTWFFGSPRLPSFVTSLRYTDDMTFSQRFMSFLIDIALFTISDRTTHYSEKYAPNKPPINSIKLLEKSSLWFLMEDLAIGYPKPQMPNTVALGDIMAQPAKPLPKDLQTFLDEATEGALIVSFGSFFDYVPEFEAKRFCEAFRRIKYRIVWKLKNAEFCSALKNAKMLPWIPQNDLLAHKNVRLFITHGGLNSLVETVYHAKPVIVFPIALDQPSNAVAVADKGYGISMKLSNFTSEELEQNIDGIFSDPSYAEKAKHASSILKARPNSPAQRASFLIEHVIKHGDNHLRTGALKLPAFQFIMFDIFLFLLCLFTSFILVIAIFVYCCYKSCGKCFFINKKLKEV